MKYNPLNKDDILRLDQSTIFIYLVITIVIVVYVSSYNVSIGVLTGIIIAFVAIYLINRYSTSTRNLQEAIINRKEEIIKPNISTTRITKYEEFINFLFSIQDMYVYNPIAYESMVDDIDNFLIMYEHIMIDDFYSGYDYEIMDDKKRSALNNLQSILIRLPVNTEIYDKLNHAVSRLEDILNFYMDKIYHYYRVKIYNIGYTTNIKHIEPANSPRPADHYDDFWAPKNLYQYCMF